MWKSLRLRPLPSIEIAADGHISGDEIDDFIYIQEELERISITVETLQLWSERMLANGIIDPEIYNARKIRLGIFRDWHRAVARRCGYGEMTADFPVSMVAEHPDALIRMTEFVANLED